MQIQNFEFSLRWVAEELSERRRLPIVAPWALPLPCARCPLSSSPNPLTLQTHLAFARWLGARNPRASNWTAYTVQRPTKSSSARAS